MLLPSHCCVCLAYMCISNDTGSYHLASLHQVCACVAAGIHAAAAQVVYLTYEVYHVFEGPCVKAAKALGLDAWSTPFYDSFIGRATLLHTREPRSTAHTEVTAPSQVSGDAGCIVFLLYILARRYFVLWKRALAAVIEHINDSWVWPRPLRRRRTRRRPFKACRDVFAAMLGLAVLYLLLTNSASQPNPVADKWYTKSAQAEPAKTATEKQSGSVNQRSALQQQWESYLASYDEGIPATSLLPAFAKSSTLWTGQVSDHVLSQPNAATTTHAAIIFPMLQDQAPRPAVTIRPTALGLATALMRAPSRALVLAPRLPVCPAVFSSHVLFVKAQHTLTVRPFQPMYQPMFKLSGLIVAHTEDWCSTTTPAAAANVAVAPPTSDLGCNSSMMCCLCGSLTQPQPASSTAYSASAFAAFSNFLRHAPDSAYTDFLPELRSLSWPHTLLLGTFLYLLGIVVPGMFFLCAVQPSTFSMLQKSMPASRKLEATIRCGGCIHYSADWCIIELMLTVLIADPLVRYVTACFDMSCRLAAVAHMWWDEPYCECCHCSQIR